MRPNSAIMQTISTKHVLTADYLGTPFGSTSVSYAAAAPFLTWGETGLANTIAMHDAGIKTMTYVTPNRTYGPGTGMYTSDESTFAHTCSGYRVYDSWDGKTEYVMNPASPDMRTLFHNYVEGMLSHGHLDAVFADVAGPLSAYNKYDPFKPGLPCGYSDSSWLSAEIGLKDASPVPVIFNGLSELNGKAPSLSLELLNAEKTLGGTMENCYTSNTLPKESSWLWAVVENTELETAAKNKQFHCYENNTNAASYETDVRMYAYASFLLTYNPKTSVYRSEFKTPSGFHVLPETEFVPLYPMVATPSNVSGLEQRGGTYARQFKYCYLHGSYVGPCAVVVNPDPHYSHPFPYTTYHHTLYISGNDVLEGGIVSSRGAAPPSYLGPEEARIVFL